MMIDHHRASKCLPGATLAKAKKLRRLLIATCIPCAVLTAVASVGFLSAWSPAVAQATDEARRFWVLFANEDVILGARPETQDRSRLTLLLLFREPLLIQSDDTPSRARTSELTNVAVDCRTETISVKSFYYRDAAGTLFRGAEVRPASPAYKQDLAAGILTFACRRESRIAVQTQALTGEAFELWARPRFLSGQP